MSDQWSVLVVDDEPPIRAELRYLLEQDERIGRVDEAGGATQAVEKILGSRPDVLFLDIQMPGTSGIKLAETLSNLKTPPVVVFVTAFAEYAATAFELDAVDYVLKPVETKRLEKALDKVATAAPVGRARRQARVHPRERHCLHRGQGGLLQRDHRRWQLFGERVYLVSRTSPGAAGLYARAPQLFGESGRCT